MLWHNYTQFIFSIHIYKVKQIQWNLIENCIFSLKIKQKHFKHVGKHSQMGVNIIVKRA